MKSRTFKKLTAMMIAVMLVFSMCVTGISASAAAVSDGTRVVYLKPNSNWLQSNARFAVYMFKGATNTWTDMADEDGDGYYEATLPEGEWEKIIFCRMNPGTTTNDWSKNNQWNQTLDLDIPDDMNCYTVKDATWDKGGGEWSLYDPENPTEPPSTEATEGTTKQVITGDPDSYYLFGYINNANYACEEDSENAGEYKFVDNQVTAKFDANSYVAVKKGDNSAWYMTEGWLGESVTSALLKNTNDIASGANKLFVPAGVEVTFTLVDNGDDTFTLSYASATDPTGSTDPTEVTEPTEPVAVDYYLFGSINGANYGCEEDYENMGDYKFVDGKLTVEFTEMSYIGVKTTNNSAWYMTDGWLGVVNEATLYKTGTLGENANKLVVPAGVVTFTLVVNDDDTLTLSYESDVVPTIPTEEPTDPTEPVPVDYYLFGSINGANYGCEEDYANMGDYKFVDGKLTVEFTEMSYIGVKTTNNSAWYMTDGWLGVVNEATLYKTGTLGENANKLVVPAGVVTFTLVVNDDDTLTLSYESDVVPTIPTDPVETTEPATEPTTEPATEPTTEPVIGETTLKFIVPKTKTSPKCWDNGVYLAYSDNYVLSTFTKIALTKTTEYLTPEIKSSNLTEDTYAMYQVTLTAEQAKAVNDAKFTILMNNENSYRTYINAKYNILMAPVGSDTEVYNTAKTSISALDGYTFVMNNEVQLGTSIQGFGTFTGFWTKCIDIHAVAPSAAKWNNCWNKGVYLCYSDTYTLDSFTKIKMTRTSTYVDVTSNSEQLISGSYPVYTVSLTEDQVRAIDAAKFVIFEDSTGAYRTYINARYGILQAPVDEYSDTYGSRVSIADRANNTFVMCGGISTGTSIEGYGTFTGYWSTTQLEIVESTATLYCVFPTPSKNKKAMNDGVYLAYGNSGAIGDLTYLEMEKTTQTYTPSLKTNMLVAGDYSVYKITLTGSQLEAVDNAHNVIFCNKTGSYRTILVSTYNVFKAKSGTYSATYNAGKFVAEDHNGETFVVCDSKVTGISSTDGYGTFLGFWDTGK